MGVRQHPNCLPGEWRILVADGDWGWRGAATDPLPRRAWTGDREQHVVGTLGLTGQVMTLSHTGTVGAGDWAGGPAKRQVKWVRGEAMAEPKAKGFLTSLKKGSQQWESLQVTRGAGGTAMSDCVSGTTHFSRARTIVFSQALFPSLTAPVLLPQTPPNSASHLSPALLLTESNKPLLLSVISDYTFLITEKWQYPGWL